MINALVVLLASAYLITLNEVGLIQERENVSDEMMQNWVRRKSLLNFRTLLDQRHQTAGASF